MFKRQFECPSCGATLERNNPGSKSLSCGYCGQTSHVGNETLDAVGQKQLLLDYGSSIELFRRYNFGGKRGEVRGRLRLEYEDGFWDEWYIALEDGTTAWLQEDDGSFVLYDEIIPFAGNSATVKDIGVGTYIHYSDIFNQVFVVGKGAATVKGGEGELPFAIVPGEKADFVDGYQYQKVVSLELIEANNYEVHIGKPLDISDIVGLS